LAVDTAANPLTYVTPYQFTPDKPLTYLSPYTYYSSAIVYNNLTDSVEDYVRFAETQMDPYSVVQYAWTFARKNQVANFQVEGEQDEASLETLESVFFNFQDPKFPGRGKTRSVLIPATRKKLKFTYWLQPGSAPVVYVVPGLGSHRQAGPALALAELVFQSGFSAVCVSSAFNSEFMEQASTVAMPAYTPVDVHDLQVALTQINRRLEEKYPRRLNSRTLLGYSMGGFHSLFIAASAATNQARLIKFDRYVAINSPVRMLHGVAQLDEFFQAPLVWPSGERTSKLENTFLKVAALSKTSLTPHASLPFSAVESKFLIGVAFRLILRDVIFSSQRRTNRGVLKHSIKNLRRDPVYQEILRYSYRDYLEQFVIPYFQSLGVDLTGPGALEKAGDLRTRVDSLRGNQDVRLIVNRNDILLADEDLAWLEATFGPDRLSVFEKGGHLGNLAHPAVQKAIIGALDGLKLPP
jgi:pimeloyl-ACP methyl ester carboxylesterase